METITSTKTGRFTVHQTKDYSVFKFPEFQREVNRNVVKQLKSNIKEYGGLLQPVVVDVAGNVIDGQHRIQALIELELPVHYVINHAIQDIEDSSYACRDANNTGSKWKALAYANWAGNNGNEVVKEAQAIAEAWSEETKGELTVFSALELMNGSSVQQLKNDLNNLNFTLDLKTAKNVFDFAMVLSEKMVASPFTTRMIRPLKMLSLEKDGLDLKVAKKMCRRKHIQVFASQKENYKFLKELYEKCE